MSKYDLASWERELLYGSNHNVTTHDVRCFQCGHYTRFAVPNGPAFGSDRAGEVDRLRREVTDLQRQVNELDAVKVELNKELVALRDRLAVVEEEGRHHAEMLAAMTTERDALDEEADHLAEALEEVADERDYLRDTVAWAEGELLKVWERREDADAA